MKLILKYLLRYKKLLLLDIIAVFGFALVELGIPTIIAAMIDNGVINQDKEYLFRMGAIIVVISIAGVVGTILIGYCCAKISTAITRDIRNDIFVKVQEFSPSEFNQFGISSLITRTNNDAFQIQMFVNVILRMALITPVMIIASFAITIATSLDLSYVIMATIPIIIIGVIIVAKISEPISQNQQASLDFLNRISRENLTGIRVIRAFTNDAHEQNRFDETNVQYTNYSKKVFKLMSITQPAFFFLMNLAAATIFVVASYMINDGTLHVGKLVAFQDYLFHAMFSVMLFCNVFVMYPRARVSALRVEAILKTNPIIKNTGDAMGDNTRGTIEFKNVTFVYPDSDEPVLKDISFTANVGETIAFIGSTGSGKSTLVNLIPRFYNVSGGEILINGINIEDYDIKELRNKIGFIPQKAMLFAGTIKENICFGKEDATDEEIIHASKIAQGYEFIMNKPKGFDEVISENATNISGGQKQRLAIARAIVRKPDIYIFDDSFSALDLKTDANLRKSLSTQITGAIVLIVAQRISSIMDADKIIVLHEGKIKGIGKHQALLKECPIYLEIASSQLSEEELKNGK